MTESNHLSSIIHSVRRRRWTVTVLQGVAITIAAAAAFLLALSYTAYRFRYSNGTLISLRIVALLGLGAAIYFFLIRPLRNKVSDAQVAHLIEEKHTGLEDRLTTAVEYENQKQLPIIARLWEDANQKAGEVAAHEVVPRKRLLGYGGIVAATVALFIGVVLFGPKQISTGLTHLLKPVTAESLLSANAQRITVKPGTARVPKGSDQQFLATLVNFAPENLGNVTFYYRKAGSDDQWVGQVMEAAKNKNDYQYFIFNIQDTIEYFVESGSVKSDVYKLDVADLPFVKRIDVKLDFPAYTGMPSKMQEDSGDIAALKGTVATIKAVTSAKAKAAFIVLKDGKKIPMTAAEQRLESGEVETFFTGSVTVAANTSYHIELTSVDNDVYNGSNEHDITVLEDEPPTVTFEKPGRDIKATSIEEIFTQVKAEDDYGVASLELYYSVNGGDEKKVQLQNLSRAEAKTLSGSHTFFLEEHSLKPGDFVSYYAKARDAANETTSDIYFIEVKPFEKEFRQGQQQQGQGQGQGGEQEQALPRRQKDIIAATFRINREEARYTPAEKKENYDTVSLAQDKLREDANGLIDRIKRRTGEGGGPQGGTAQQFTQLIENLKTATKEMEGASTELKAQRGQQALPYEQRALQQLLRADAIFREIQVSMSQQGQGQGQQSQQAEELADLFELELDKMKNQYETLKREEKQQGQQQDDETKRKLEELARRQQKELEQQQRRQQQARNQQGGGGGSSRQQQDLIEETRNKRELENSRANAATRNCNSRLTNSRRLPKKCKSAGRAEQQQFAGSVFGNATRDGKPATRAIHAAAKPTRQERQFRFRPEEPRRRCCTETTGNPKAIG
ncbi:MAG: DUF4175 family protein [Blastocatellia bacterium]